MSELALKRELVRRMTLSALQIRLNVQQRNEPLFTFVDFNQQNWPREGCAVCSLDLTTDIQVRFEFFLILYRKPLNVCIDNLVVLAESRHVSRD